MHKEQQSATDNRLWVGVLCATDRMLLIERAMQGHMEAAERLKTFRG
jgi:hypothetical protein